MSHTLICHLIFRLAINDVIIVDMARDPAVVASIGNGIGVGSAVHAVHGLR